MILPVLAFGEFAPYLFVGFAVLVIFGIWYSHVQARKRREAMAAWARSMNARFDPSRDHAMDSRYREFGCLHKGNDRYAFNIVHGWRGERVMLAFDYHYETESRDSKGRRTTTDHYFSAVVIDSKLPLRPLVIRPEGFFDKIGEFFGFDDIDFELNEFSRKFYVKAPDRKWAFDVIHQETMEFLLGMPKFTLEFYRGDIIAHNGSRFSIEEFNQAIAVIEGVLDRLPDYLLREMKGVD